MDFHGFLLIDEDVHKEADAQLYRRLSEVEWSGDFDEALKKAARVLGRGAPSVEVKVDATLGLLFQAMRRGRRVEPSLVGVNVYSDSGIVSYTLAERSSVEMDEAGWIYTR